MSTLNVKTKVAIDWNVKKEKLLQRFSSLTERDLQFEEGKMGEMLERLAAKVGKTRHELYQLIAKP